MANCLDQTFASLRSPPRKALVAYIAAGDPFPTVEGTAEVVLDVRSGRRGCCRTRRSVFRSARRRSGDPGRHAARSRQRGESAVRLRCCAPGPPSEPDSHRLDGLLRQCPQGWAGAFASEMAEAGADGVILSDLPPEEADAWKAEADARDLATIFLLAPTSTADPHRGGRNPHAQRLRLLRFAHGSHRSAQRRARGPARLGRYHSRGKRICRFVSDLGSQPPSMSVRFPR